MNIIVRKDFARRTSIACRLLLVDHFTRRLRIKTSIPYYCRKPLMERQISNIYIRSNSISLTVVNSSTMLRYQYLPYHYISLTVFIFHRLSFSVIFSYILQYVIYRVCQTLQAFNSPRKCTSMQYMQQSGALLSKTNFINTSKNIKTRFMRIECLTLPRQLIISKFYFFSFN